MNIQLLHDSPKTVPCDWLIVPLAEGDFSPAVAALDAHLGGSLARLKDRGDLTGKLAEIVDLRDVPSLAAQRVALVGLGAVEKLTSHRLDQALTTVARRISAKKTDSIACLLPEAAIDKLGRQAVASITATAFIVGSVGPGLYKGEKDRFPIPQLLVIDPDSSKSAECQQGLDKGVILGEAVNLTRELVNRHPHDIVPETFAARAVQEVASLPIQAEVFDLTRLQQEKMGSLLAVARGSALEPRVVILRYQGGAPGAPPLALVGKGVTFDSGGLSLKPSDGMKTMKGDMAGAATVLGALTAIARLQIPVNVIGLMGLVENMPSSTSYKLGEVLTARNGVTIEVQNTDAEGRLVLADVLCYAVDQGADRIIDLATLTGSCVVALGEEVSGVFSNHQKWCDQLISAARDAGEEVWQMPMYDSFNDQLKCDVADVKNIGTRWGGAITAAKFLEKFVSEKPWVHLDIAGPAFCESTKPHRDAGGTGAMVRGLVELASRLS